MHHNQQFFVGKEYITEQNSQKFTNKKKSPKQKKKTNQTKDEEEESHFKTPIFSGHAITITKKW